MNVNEAFEILKSEGITKNVESVRRWIRNGELKAELRGKNRNSGYEIKEKDLEEFILSKLSPKEIEEYKKRKQTGAAENEFQKNYIRLQEIEKRLSEIKLVKEIMEELNRRIKEEANPEPLERFRDWLVENFIF